ncbi:MAG: archaemetzincin family Zn-dependent metalloprotease [Candidatus Nezhaarchaeales archaeon]
MTSPFGNSIKVLLQPIGSIGETMYEVSSKLNETFKLFTFVVSCKRMEVPFHAFNEDRGQYNSSVILDELSRLYNRGFFEGYQRIIGLVDVDAYVLGLNFVFGEALLGGPVAVVYLARLKPEFYGKSSNQELLIERTCKEVVHELGHTFGLRHCSNPRCVMYFSNTIFDTDHKDLSFCLRCQSLLIGNLMI